MLMTLFCFFKISIKLKNSHITLTFNILISSLHLKLKSLICYLFLTLKSFEKTTDFTMSIYCKPTFSSVFPNFESFIPNLYKYALIFALLHRAFKLCSNFELFHQEIENLKSIFREKNFC